MHTISKIFNSLEKIAAFKQRELQATREMEKVAATVSRGLLKLLRARKSFITKALKKNPALSRKEALASFYKKYGLQVGKGGKLSAIKDMKLNKSLAAKQQEWLNAMRENRSLSYGIRGLRKLQATDPSRVGKALAAMSKKFNLSEANKDFILSQKLLKNTDGRVLQNSFRLNRKPSSLARSLRRRKPAPDVPPGPNPPGPNPPGPTPPGPNPPGPNPPGPNPPGPNPPGPNPPGPNPPGPNPPGPNPPGPNPPKPAPDTPPGGGGTPKPGTDPAPKPGTDPAPKPGAGGEGGQYGPNSPDTPVTSPLGNPNNNWWKWLLGGAAGGYTLRAITEPQPEPQDLTANTEAQYANAMMNGTQY